METQRRNAHRIGRPRFHEDRETVRRQQKELRRIRQRERRQKMTVGQIEKQRERARQYYLWKKNQQPMKLTKQTNVSMVEPRMDTAVEMKQLSTLNHAYMFQQRENLEDQKFMKQTAHMTVEGESTNVTVESKISMLIRHRNRLTHVKREARSRVVRGNEDVRPLRLTHIRRQARGLSGGVVGRSDKYGIDFQKLGSSPEKNGSYSLIQDHAQILIDISRMNTCPSTSFANCSKESMKIDLNMSVADDQSRPWEDASESTSDSEEVLAFLSGLSAQKSFSRA